MDHFNLIAMSLVVILFVLFIYYNRKSKRKSQRKRGRLKPSDLNRLLQTAREIDSIKADRPKSLNNMERIYYPLIEKDFPNLRVDQLKYEAENLLIKSYQALEKGDKNLLGENTSPYYLSSLRREIQANRNLGPDAIHFSDVKIHDSALSQYGRDHGKRIIEFQFAVEAMAWSDKKPEKEKLQMRDMIRYQLIDDLNKFRKEGGQDKLLSKNCPNCGAPLSSNHTGKCPYCGTYIGQIEWQAWVATQIEPELWDQALSLY